MSSDGLRILLANYEWPGITTNCGGGGAVSKALRDGLTDRDHEVHVVTDDADGHYATYPARAYRRLKRGVAWADVAAGHFSVPTSLPLARLCHRRETPLAVSVMGADVYDPTRYGYLRPLLNAANRYVFARADAVIVPSTDMRERVAELGTDADVIHYGIDPDAWDWHARDLHDPVRVLTVCRLVERKNLGVARRAIQRLQANTNRDVDWRVVGTGPLLDTVTSWTEADARGYVDDLQAAYDWGDVFFLPSEHEAFGMVFLEALASGLPVVTSDVGGQTDIVEQRRVGQYDYASPLNQAKALRIVADDYDWYQSSTEGYVAERFSRKAMVDRYETLFQELQS